MIDTMTRPTMFPGVTLFQMPLEQYAEDRDTAFYLLASAFGFREIELRVALSNVFVSMARQGRVRY